MPLLLFIFLPIIASIDTESCGKTKDCIFSPPGCSLPQCDYFLSLSSLDEWTTFELATANISTDTSYLALGMSEDDVMGEEPVTFCHFPSDGNPPTVNVALNEGKSNRVADTAINDLVRTNVEMLHAEKRDDTLFCTFRQRITPTSPHEMLAPLNKKFTLFIARGQAPMPLKLQMHELNPASKDFPFISPSAINLTRFFPLQADSTTSSPSTELPSTTSIPAPAGFLGLSQSSRLWLIRFHGILMVVPWLSLIPSAILAARYMRQEWNAYSPGGLHIWFHIHRTLNYFSFFLFIISFLLVFVAKDLRWTGPWWNKKPGKLFGPGSIHSAVGAIALCGVILQVVGSLLRPSPDSKLRPYFNTFHRSIGFVSLINALVATVIAANFFLKYWSDKWKALLLVLLAAFLIILAFVLFIVEDRLAHKRREEEIEMSGGVSVSVAVEPKRERMLRKILFVSFFIFSLALSVYIVLQLIV